MLEQISFLIMGVFTLFLSILIITRKKPVTSAMLLIVVMMLIAGMYGLLGAHFSAVSQIIVYAGAIMVVFVFVIMLLNISSDHLRFGRLTLLEFIFIVVGVILALILGTKVGSGYLQFSAQTLAHSNARAPYYPLSMNENVKNVSALMFTDYLWSFELISFLILSSIIGSVVIAKKEKTADVKSA